MANINRASTTVFNPTIIANTALEILRNNIVLAKLITRDTDITDRFTVGDTLNIPYPGSMVANDKVTNTPVTLQVPTASNVSITLSKHKEASFLLEDAARAIANQDVMTRYINAATIAIAEQVENDIFSVYSSFTASTGVSGTDLTATNLRSARKLLNDRKASKVGRSIVVSDKDEISILGDTTLQSYFAFAKPDAVSQGSIGSVYGFDIYQSQLVPVVAGSPNSTKNIAFAPEAMLLAMRSLPDAPPESGAHTAVVTDPISGLAIRCVMAYNATNLGVQCTLDVLYGVSRLRDEFGLVVLS